MLTRRAFLTTALATAVAARSHAADLVRQTIAPRQEALYYQKSGDNSTTVRCALCPRRCT